MRAGLQIIGWLACVVYSTIPLFWLMIHPFAKRWRARQRSPYRLLMPVWMAMWLAEAAITAPWRSTWLYRADWAWVPAALLFSMGLLIYSSSAKTFRGTPRRRTGIREQWRI